MICVINPRSKREFDIDRRMIDCATILQCLCLLKLLTPEERGDEYGIARTETDFVTAQKGGNIHIQCGGIKLRSRLRPGWAVVWRLYSVTQLIICHLYDRQDKMTTKILLLPLELLLKCVGGLI